MSLNDNPNGHQANPENNNLENSGQPAANPVQLPLAFTLDLAPQEPGRKVPLLKRLQADGLQCYSAIFEELMVNPPDWETRFWTDHPNRRRNWWRKAAYIAWAAAPGSARRPRKQKELADLLGISPQIICKWQNDNPKMGQMIEALALAPFEAALRDVDFVTIYQAQQLDSPANVRKLFYERWNEIVAARQPVNPQQVNQLLQVIFNNLNWDSLPQNVVERLAAGKEDPLAVLVSGIGGGDGGTAA